MRVKLSNVLKFTVDNIKLMDNINQSLFRKVRIKAFATGNNAHTLPIDNDVLERGAKTIYDKPIVWKYDKYLDDAMGHEKDEIPCGFVKESEDNPIRFEKDMGKTFIVIDALIWTRYCGKLLDIFHRDNMKKSVSIEIAVIEDKTVISDKPKIKDFVIAGITILGEYINPACKGCNAELLEFSEAKTQYLNELSFVDKFIPIDNTKESSVNGIWSNPRRKLFNPISNAKNKVELLKEAYLVGDFDTKEPEITKFKYPHHIIKDGKLVIHQKGLEAAFQRASQQDIVYGKVKAHLLRHYRELGLNTENFADFNISREDFELYFYNEIYNSEGVGEHKMNEIKDVKTVEKEVIKKEVPETKMCDMPVGVIASEKFDIDDDISIEDAKEKIAEMIEVIKKLEKENNVYMEKIKDMADYEDLKIFKKNTEEEKIKEKEMAEMEKVMSDIEKRGINMSENDRTQLMAQIKNFSSIDAWANFAKAQVFDKIENVDGVAKIGLPFANSQKSVGSIWDRI